MCETCGCPGAKKVDVNKVILAANEAQARINRRHIEAMGAVAINLISSPGSGKTTLLEKTIDMLDGVMKIGVIEGDIETERDAERIRTKGIPAIQLTTSGACHLDAPLVHRGLHELEEQLDGAHLDIIFIENVGNLVCPAAFNLGEHERAVLLSVPEGSDKPAKYPTVFLNSQVFLVTKTDLLPYFPDFSQEEAKKEALRLNPHLKIISLSAVTGLGMDDWMMYLQRIRRKNII
ncbi:MAG: hydrogenase nickel incorporation protein HypB [Dissulfurimicrobium sp.]|uniref:hydrogenase nickel incorporation protein HypB n=1 Tax=Dissulfurimicrobium TaxID=1769732 RepID=UPI001EDA5F5E|nr:hydrogenase nickel incorporation protein HypB [Dissulfurimicrobium hydrothermale]UKL13592.1 hydrogenase nickel incorporation protein HypB [Dissulfurimicrobium hydrothermale]